jgi:hypothetical protein
MNAMSRSAKHSRNDLESSPTPFAREATSATGAWPMIAQIGDPVTDGNEIVGFRWNEARYQKQWSIDPTAREFSEEENNYCIPLDVKPADYANLEIKDTLVHLHYINSPDGIILYFKLGTTASATVDFLKITKSHNVDPTGPTVTPYCTGFNTNRRYEVDIVNADADFFTGAEFNTQAPLFSGSIGDYENVYAYNLLEYRGGNLGGGADIADCDYNVDLATLPPNTLVLGKLIAQWQSNQDETNPKFSRAYAFSVANDACVECCLETGGLLSPQARGNAIVQRRIRTLSPLSVVDEMQR